MKRTATLVAGLLLVTGTVFGASEWKMTGANVEGTYYLSNSATGSLGSSQDNDLDMEVKVEKSGDFGTLGLRLQMDKDGDEDLELLYSRTQGDWTVGTAAILINADGGLLNGTSTSMKKNDETYIKWNVMGSKTTALTFYPYGVGGMSFDNETFESFIDYGNPGLKLDTKIANTNVAFTLATDNGDDNTENQNTFKVAADTKVAGFDIKVAAGVGETTKTYAGGDTFLGKISADAGTTTTTTTLNTVTNVITTSSTTTGADTGTYVKEGNFIAAQAKTTLGKISVLAEFNTESAEFSTTAGAKQFEVTQTGIYGKVSYDMGTMNTYKLTPYASLEITDYEVKYPGLATGDNTETDLEAGLDINQGSFTVTPKIVINSSDEKIYNKEKATNAETEKDKTMVGIEFKYAL